MMSSLDIFLSAYKPPGLINLSVCLTFSCLANSQNLRRLCHVQTQLLDDLRADELARMRRAQVHFRAFGANEYILSGYSPYQN